MGKGLYPKYAVFKTATGEEVKNCFVLCPEKDPAAVAAIRAYANATSNKNLAADLLREVGGEPDKPLTLQELREMDGEPVWIERIGDKSHIYSAWAVVNRECALCRTGDWSPAFF